MLLPSKSMQRFLAFANTFPNNKLLIEIYMHERSRAHTQRPNDRRLNKTIPTNQATNHLIFSLLQLDFSCPTYTITIMCIILTTLNNTQNYLHCFKSKTIYGFIKGFVFYGKDSKHVELRLL